MSKHTLTTELDVEIEFKFVKGTPETPPAYSHGGLPADPPEAEALSVTILGVKIEDPKLLDAIQAKFYDKMIEEACAEIDDAGH